MNEFLMKNSFNRTFLDDIYANVFCFIVAFMYTGSSMFDTDELENTYQVTPKV